MNNGLIKDVLLLFIPYLHLPMRSKSRVSNAVKRAVCQRAQCCVNTSRFLLLTVVAALLAITPSLTNPYTKALRADKLKGLLK